MGDGGQADFSVGMVRAVARDLIPEGGAYDMRDLLLDDDGNAYQRGATTRVTTTAISGAELRAIWEAQFAVGRRTVALSGTTIGVLDAAGTGWYSLLTGVSGLGGGGLAPKIGDIMVVPITVGGTGTLIGYGGSRKGSAATGTASATTGSPILVGVATGWLANAEAGMFISLSGVPVRTALIKSVDSDTQITLADPWVWAPRAAAAVSISPYTSFASVLPSSTPSYVASAVCSGRLLAASGHIVRMSKTVDPSTGATRPFDWDANDYHEFPADVVALAALRDRVFVFTQAGIYVISNVGLELVDAYGNAQQRVERVSGDVVLRSPGGVAPWRDSLVIAAVDGVYVMDSGGGLELISRSISPLWQQHMGLGDKVGQVATFRDHVFVSIGILGAGAGPHEVLVGRLDRRVSTPAGKSAPWTRLLSGEAGGMQAFAVQDPYGAPKLVIGLTVGYASSGHLVDGTPFFVGSALPTVAALDSSGAGFPVTMLLETRDFRPSGLNPVYVDQVRLDYESSGGTVAVAASKGLRATAGADPTFDALAAAPAGNFSTQAPRAIAVRKTGRRIAFRFTTSGTCPGLRIRAFGFHFRERGLQR